MNRIQDKQGWVTGLVCFLLLFCYHVSRDALITALPTIANYNCTFDDITEQPLEELVEDTTESPPSHQTALPHFPALNRYLNSDGNIVSKNIKWENITTNVNSTNRNSSDGLITQEPLTDHDRQKRNLAYASREAAQREEYFIHPSDNKYGSGSHDRSYYKAFQGPLVLVHKFRKLISSEQINVYHTRTNPFQGLIAPLIPVEGDETSKEEWSPGVQSSVLTIIHLSTMLGLVLGHYCIEASNVEEGIVGAAFTVQWGILVLCTQVMTPWGPLALGGLRLWQGLTQGACYPLVYRLLEARGFKRRLTLTLIFSGGWLGTAVGVGLGGLDNWCVPFYVSGALTLAVTVLMLLVTPGDKVGKTGTKCRWADVLRRDVIVCGLTHCGSGWVLHTLLLAPTILEPYDCWWALVIVACGCGISRSAMPFLTRVAVSNKTKTHRGYLVAVTTIGLVFCGTSLGLISAEDGNEISTKVIVGLTLGSVVGIGFTSAGYRLVLEVAAARRRCRMLVAVNWSGALGAVLATSLLPALGCVGGLNDGELETEGRGGFMSACLLPMSLVTISALCVFIFIIFPKSIQEKEVKKQEPSVFVVDAAAVGGADGMSQRSLDNKSFKSFKSVMSSASFRTAVSRTRMSSFNTVLEDVEEELHSLDDNSIECRSIKEEPEEDVYSVQSAATSYRSSGHTNYLQTQTSFSDLPTDRTSAWLQLHHHIDLSRVPVAAPVVKPEALPGLLM